MCCKTQKQGSRQAWYSRDTLKRKGINWGRTSAPLLFSNTFWVIWSTNFRDDQNKYGANALCFSHRWNLICVKVLTFPQVSAGKGKLKICYQQPRFPGWKKRGFLGLRWFTTHCFLSRHTWNSCVNPAFCRERADNPQLVSCFRATLMQKHRGSSEALLDFLHPHPPPPPLLPKGPPPAHLLPFILPSFPWLLSRFTPCRYCHVFAFTRRSGRAYSILWHTLDL